MFFVFALAGLGAAAAVLYVVRPKDPFIKVLEVHVKGLSVSENTLPVPAIFFDLDVTMDVIVKNPNVVPITYTEAHMDIVYEGQKLGEGEVPPGGMPAKSSRVIAIPAKIHSLEALGQLGPKLLKDMTSRSVKLTGLVTLSGQADMGVMKHPFKVKIACDAVIDPVKMEVVHSESDVSMNLMPNMPFAVPE